MGLLGGSGPARASGSSGGPSGPTIGVLVDTTLCIGCRQCEQACNAVNTDLPRRPSEDFQAPTALEKPRRMDAGAYTVVNRYQDADEPGQPVHAKLQCMHCLHPACVSACIVGALAVEPNGVVSYDLAKCIGCRYCMVACPFGVPAYEYGDALLPEVRKCNFCLETRISNGRVPACVASCPMQVMTFGKRADLVALGRERIRNRPERYVDHIYGEHEVGGTAWLYLTGIPSEKMDLPRFGYHPVPGYTEPMQHAVFKWFLPPLGLYSALTTIMWFTSRKSRTTSPTDQETANERA